MKVDAQLAATGKKMKSTSCIAKPRGPSTAFMLSRRSSRKALDSRCISSRLTRHACIFSTTSAVVAVACRAPLAMPPLS